MANIRTVSSLGEVNGALQEIGINTIDQAHQVQFRLHKQTSLKEATEIKMMIQTGRHGFRLVNPELLDCKFDARVKLEEWYNTMLDACMAQCDHELFSLEASIAELKDLMLSTDDQIPHIGPEVHHRNRGVQQMLYPNPPFPIDPDYEFGTPQQRVPYQAAYTTDAERNDAVSRDKRAQRAVWNTNLRLLEVKKSALEKNKTELERRLKAEFKKVNEQQSDLGVGYANYQSPYQA
ncbi:hypothetical protein OsI_02312 [Oryza sativa Indica Group]|uniref:Uncharacterized protein n=1 Tax=Oryza sativa subsp. indica TaxID=39946 RepID=A2WR26_ORYSI|nr:hypothetical protein OsI_02312 [Oryza sativa Indica Group]